MTCFYSGDIMPLDFVTKMWVQIYNQNEELCHAERKLIPTREKGQNRSECRPTDIASR